MKPSPQDHRPPFPDPRCSRSLPGWLRSLPHAALALAGSGALLAAPQVQIASSQADAHFQLGNIPAPAVDDLASHAKFTVLDGTIDPSSRGLAALADGVLPDKADQPDANFFFSPASEGGRLLVDLGQEQDLAAIATYSWHPAARAAQWFRVYAATGKDERFAAVPRRPMDPERNGWTLLASVDTRKEAPGQHAVLISGNQNDSLGSWRYLLFDIGKPDPQESFSNTFFSEIDVIASGSQPWRHKEGKLVHEFQSPGGKYSYQIDLTAAPDLRHWSVEKLAPVVAEWYPKIVDMLPSPGFRAAKNVRLTYAPDTKMRGTPAWAAGTEVTMNADWYRKQLEGEARGCTIHELVHVVQAYGRGRHRAPGWLTEGMPDYIRWFLYEPQTHGAGLKPEAADRVKYSDSYRTTANFLDWVFSQHKKDLLATINAAARKGEYREEDWKKWAGGTLEELEKQWKQAIREGQRR